MNIDNLSSKIVAHTMKGDWITCKKVMESIFAEESKLEIIAELINRLPNTAFELFFLNGLSYISQMEAHQFKNLFSLLKANPLGMYNLERFFVGYGGITRKDFSDMVGNLDYSATCDVDEKSISENNLANVRIMSRDEYTKMMCVHYDVPIDHVVAFHEKLKSLKEKQ